VKTILEIVTNRYLLGLAAGLAAVVGLSFVLPPAPQALARFFAYISVACNTIPLPTTPLIIYMGREYHWIAVALVGGVATSLANLLDYEVFSSVYKTKLLTKIRESKHSQASIRAFTKVGFLALLAANLFIWTWDVVRLVAIAAKYPRLKYVAATFVGRTVRYGALAAVGEFFEPPLWAILAFASLLAVPAIVSWLRDRLKRRASKEEGGDAAGEDPHRPG
jgi:membrane protein YqaA with SNARE-associated domain